jgi:hypothetical protein
MNPLFWRYIHTEVRDDENIYNISNVYNKGSMKNIVVLCDT